MPSLVRDPPSEDAPDATRARAGLARVARGAWLLAAALLALSIAELARGSAPDQGTTLGRLLEKPEAVSVAIAGAFALGHALLAALLPVTVLRWLARPGRPSQRASGILAIGALLALEGVILHFAPESGREPFCQGFEAAALYSGFAVLVLGLALLVEGRAVPGRSLALPGLFLAGLGGLLYASHLDDWQREDWSSCSDPPTLVRACESAIRAHGPTNNMNLPIMTSRQRAATEARARIERRLFVLRGEAVPALVDALAGRDNWPEELLDRIGEPARPALLGALAHGDSRVREQAVWVLFSLPQTPETREAVRRLLRDVEPRVRSSAACYFRAQRDTNLVPSVPPDPTVGGVAEDLIALLDDPDPDVRSRAVETLREHKCRLAIPRLAAMLDQKDVGSEVSSALRDMGDPAVVPLLTRAFNKNTKGPAGSALLSCGSPGLDVLLSRLDLPEVQKLLRPLHRRDLELDEKTHRHLLRLLADPDPTWRRVAAGVLARAKDATVARDALSALQDADVHVRATAAGALFERGLATREDFALFLTEADEDEVMSFVWHVGRVPENAGALEAIALDPHRSLFARTQTLKVLWESDRARWKKACEEILRNDSTDVRSDVLMPFYTHTCPFDTSTLIALLDDAEPRVRSAAAWALRDRRDPLVVNALVRLLETEKSDRIPVSVVQSLGELHACEAVPTLIKLIEQNSFVAGDPYDLPGAAVAALGEIGDPRALGTLRKVLATQVRGADHYSVNMAAAALGLVGDKSAIPWLREAVRRPRSTACGMGGSCCPDAVAAVHALGRLGEDGATELLGVLDEWESREFAVEALAETHSPHAFARLVETLQEPWHGMRHSSAIALGKLGDPRAIEPLIAALDDPALDVVEAAGWALERLTGRDFGAGELRPFDEIPDRGRADTIQRAVTEWTQGTRRGRR